MVCDIDVWTYVHRNAISRTRFVVTSKEENEIFPERSSFFSLFRKGNATETEVERNTTKFRARKAHGNLYRWQQSGGHTCARKGGCCTRAKWDLHARARARRRFRFQSTTRRRDSGTHSTNYVHRPALSRSVLRRVEKRKLRREQFRNSDANALINRSCSRREIIWIFGASRWQGNSKISSRLRSRCFALPFHFHSLTVSKPMRKDKDDSLALPYALSTCKHSGKNWANSRRADETFREKKRRACVRI